LGPHRLSCRGKLGQALGAEQGLNRVGAILYQSEKFIAAAGLRG